MTKLRKVLGVAVLLLSLAVGVEAGEIEKLLIPEVSSEKYEVAISPGKTVIEEKTVHAGHRVLHQRISLGGKMGYRLHYRVCLEKEAHPGLIEVWPAEQLAGLGLRGPTYSWYVGGCIDILINKKSVGPYRAKFKKFKYIGEKGSEVSVTWDTSEAKVNLIFRVREGDEKLFLEGNIEPKTKIESLKVVLRCYPCGFGKGKGETRERWISTSQRDVSHTEKKGRITLGKDEPWVFYYDKKLDREINPKGRGPCALIYLPDEVGSVRVIPRGNYNIDTHLTYPSKTRKFHMGLLEFPKWTNKEALEYMKKLDSPVY